MSNLLETNPQLARVLCWVFAAVGGIVFILGIMVFLSQWTFIQRALHTSGEIIDLEYQSSTKSGGHVGVFSFVDHTGVRHVLRTKVASNPPAVDIGDVITILYGEDDPSAARIKSFRELWLLPTFLAGFGVVWVFVGSVALLGLKRTIHPAKAILQTPSPHLASPEGTPEP